MKCSAPDWHNALTPPASVPLRIQAGAALNVSANPANAHILDVSPSRRSSLDTQLTDGGPHALAELDIKLNRAHQFFVAIRELSPR